MSKIQLHSVGNSDGISMLEVLISMIILAVGILGMAPLMMTSLNTVSESRELSVASELAKERIEFYEAQDSLPPPPFYEDEGVVRDNFSRETYIYDHDSDASVPEGRFQVSVKVTWTTADDVQRTTNLSTLMSKG